MSSHLDEFEKAALENGPPAPERIDYLDGWRGVAIASVLLAHFSSVRVFDFGRLGVDVFFCLSGMLMAKLLFLKRTPLKIFYQRRISRILPVFVLFLLVMYSLAFLTGKRLDFSEMLSTLAFFRTYYPAVPHIWDDSIIPSGHLWSLNVEEHSYILMSLLTLIPLVKKRAGLFLLAVGGAATLMTIYYAAHSSSAPDFYRLRTECAVSFIMISAGYSLVNSTIKCFVKPWVPVVSMLVALCCYFKGFPSIKIILAPVLISFTVNHLSEIYQSATKMLCFRPLRLLGLWSYSIYLWQQPFYLNKETMYPGVALVMAVIAGAASFYIFENPTRMWLNGRGYSLLSEPFLKRKTARAAGDGFAELSGSAAGKESGLAP